MDYISENIDSDSDGFLSKDECEAVEVIEINDTYELFSLVGIEHFPNLKELYFECGFVTTLDASKNTALEYIDCYGNDMTEIDLSGCANLKEVFGQGNAITNLDISGCTSLERLEFGSFTDLHTLNGISDCKNMKELSIGCIDASLLDLSAMPELEKLWFIVDDLSEIDTSHNPKLRELRATGKTGSIDISRNTELEILEIDGWGDVDADLITSLDLSQNPKLEYFGLYGSHLHSIDLSNNPELENITLSENYGISELDLSENKKLHSLYCYGNGLTSINVRNCPELDDLICSENFLTEIDVSGNPNLRELACANNKLTSLDTSSCPILSNLNCSHNELSSLDLSKNTHLRNLEIHHNAIAEINVQGIEDFRILKDSEPGFYDEYGLEGVCEYYYEDGFDSWISIRCDTETKVIF